MSKTLSPKYYKGNKERLQRYQTFFLRKISNFFQKRKRKTLQKYFIR